MVHIKRPNLLLYCITENSKPDDEVSAADEKRTERLIKLISDIYVENDDEHVANIPNNTSEELKATESNETSASETMIEVENLETAIEETNECIPSLEDDASNVPNSHLTGTNQMDEDSAHLVSSDAVTDDQTPKEVESAAAAIPKIGQSASILDKVYGKDNKFDSDQHIKGETDSCIQDVPNVNEELEISTSDSIKSTDQVVIESIVDIISHSPAIKAEIDIANTNTNDDILEVKNDAIEWEQGIIASSDQNEFTVKRSISEATTVSRTISDDLEIKGNYCF